MTTKLVYSPPYCPEHPKEHLQTQNLIIKSPFVPEGKGIAFFHYCPKSKKYLNYDGTLVSKEEVALNFINRNYKKNYSLSEIEVLTFKESAKLKKSQTQTFKTT